MGGLLPPRTLTSEEERRPAAIPAVVVDPGEHHDEDRVAPSVASDSAPIHLERSEGSESDLDRVRNVAVYLPMDLLDRLKRTRRSRELTYSDLLAEAAAAHLSDVASTFRTPSGRVGDGMPSRPRGRRLPEPGVQVQIRLDGHQLQWLDAQASRLGAPSRTALVVALLQAHLT